MKLMVKRTYLKQKSQDKMKRISSILLTSLTDLNFKENPALWEEDDRLERKQYDSIFKIKKEGNNQLEIKRLKDLTNEYQ